MNGSKGVASANRTVEILVREYLTADRRCEDAKREKLRCDIDLNNCKHDLAMALLPKDAKIGEVIGIWVRVSEMEGEKCFLVRKVDESTYTLDIRQ